MRSSVELSTATWRKSSYSNVNGGDCIEIADGVPGVVPVRDSKDPSGPAIMIPAASWDAFVAALKIELI
ncbi:protein of unknown function [Streptomyces sp. 2224.1]|uniref:DUF397 domain-containing protein n=1 Tax=unclassified Streptomyces TaxID=2593676 RepID=UPI00089A0D7B|nr:MULTISPECIES: DUF397 domain-containing protein [unclassified Streptomyces]SEB65829.1 protein of unknown function [Streptomyces sp. 2224.1]SEE46434.1 protein of unknown function [Streptomyces sp. 2112.3]